MKIWTVVLIAALAAGILTVEAATSVKIRVINEAGDPLPEAVIRLRSSRAGLSSSTTDGLGEAALDGVGDGPWRLVVTATGYFAHRQSLEAGHASTVIVVELKENRFAQEITVTATLPSLVAEDRVPGSRLGVSRDADIGGGLRRIAGLEAFRKGAINMDPTVRGLQETQVAMMVDGTRTFAAGPGRMDSEVSHVAPRGLREARVVKGPYALTWGAGAMSAINLVSYRPSFSGGGFRSEGTAAVSYGSNAGALDAFGTWGGATDRLSFHISASQREGGDYDDGDGAAVPGEYTSTDLRWSLGFRPAGNLVLQYTGGYQEQRDIDYPGRMMDAVHFRTRSSSLEATWTPGRVVTEVYGQAYLNLKDHSMNNDGKPNAEPDPNRMPPFGVEVETPTTSDTLGGRAHLVLEKGDWRTQLGGDYYTSEQEAFRTISRRDNGVVLFDDAVWPGSEMKDLGLYAQAVRESGRLRAGGTVRADFVDASAGELSSFFLTNTSGETDHRETNFSAAVSARIRLGGGLSMSGGLGRVVRTANTLERFADRFPTTRAQVSAEFMGNPGIDPEKSLQLDLGLAGGGGELHFNVDAFYRIIDDYITLEADPNLPTHLPMSPPTVFRYVNGEEASTWGGEAGIRHSVGTRFSWRGAISYVRAEDTVLGEPVFGIAPLRGEIAWRLHFPSVAGAWVEVVAVAYDRQDRVATSRGEMESAGYTVWDLRGGASLAPGLSLEGGVRNLGDKSYTDHLNARNPFTGQRIPEMGLSAYAGVEYTF